MSLKHGSLLKFRKTRNRWQVGSWEEYEERETKLYKETLMAKEPTIKGKVRIIAGRAKNFQIDIPKSSRVLTDRLKTTVFDLLGTDIMKKTVLDLYAGSGSFGLEAISRGADFCTFVDSSKSAERVLMDNIRKTGFLTETTVLRDKAENFIELAKTEGQTYDVIFVDPPYKLFNNKHLYRMENFLNETKGLLPGLSPHAEKKAKKFKGVLIIKFPRRYPIEKLELADLELADRHDFGLNSVCMFIVGN